MSGLTRYRSPVVLRQRYVPFPPKVGGPLLPTGDRAGAQLGLTLYTACRPRTLVAQRIAYRLVGLVGTRALPGRRVTLDLAEWDDLTASWHDTVGEVRSVAQYQRKDPRSGLLLLVIPRERSPLMVKVRHSPEALDREQRLLAALQQVALPDIRVPRPAGLGHTAGGLTWAAQEFVFSRPHEPVFALDPDRIAALDRAIGEAFGLAGITEQRHDGWVPSHHDLTP